MHEEKDVCVWVGVWGVHDVGGCVGRGMHVGGCVGGCMWVRVGGACVHVTVCVCVCKCYRS